MTLTDRDKRALALLGLTVAALAVYFQFSGSPTPAAASSAAPQNVPLAEARLARVRQLAASVPAAQAVLAKADADLAQREAAIIQADTVPQAQAQVLQILRALAQKEGLTIGGQEMGPIRPLGKEYGEVVVTITMQSRIDQLLNFMADLSAQKELVATDELRLSQAAPKEKVLPVRLTVAGVVPRRLVPERKATVLF